MTTILGLLLEGVTPAGVLAYYPHLVIDDVHACVQYATRTADQPEPDQRTPPERSG